MNKRLVRFKNAIIKRAPRVTLYCVMTALIFVFLFPFIYMLVNSFMSNDDLNNFTVTWIPRGLYLSNYPLAAKLMDYFTGFRNSLIVTIISTMGQLISCSMAGYGLARFKFPGVKLAFVIVVLAMIVPVQTIIIPQYLLYGSFSWLNTFFPLTVPSFFGYGVKGALFIYIFRQFYLGLPKELEEASRVDGCGFIRTFTKIIFPISKTSYMVVLVLSLVCNWNNHFEPSMYLSKAEIYVLPMRLNNITQALSLSAETLQTTYDVGANNVLNSAVLMSGTVLTVFPLIIMFFFLQKQFVQGIERSGLTGE